MLSGGSLHTPQSLMSRPRSWQSNGHSVSGEIKLLIGFLKISWLNNQYCIHGWVATVKNQDGDDLFIRSADARQTSSLLLTPNIQPKLYDVHTQSAANSWSLPLPSPVSWRGWKRIILANILVPPTSKDTADPVLCPCVPLMGWGWPPFRADIINGQPGAQA